MHFLKTWKKFRKPGENFQKSFGHPELNKHLTLYMSTKTVRLKIKKVLKND